MSRHPPRRLIGRLPPCQQRTYGSAAKEYRQSISSSPATRRVWGTERPSAFATLTLIIRRKRVGCSHAEHPKHGDVRVSGLDRRHVLEDRLGYALHGIASRVAWSPICASPESLVGIVSMRSRRRSPRE